MHELPAYFSTKDMIPTESPQLPTEDSIFASLTPSLYLVDTYRELLTL
jgi:hypothetical protein